MTDDTSVSKAKKVKKFFSYISKIISSALIVILVLVGAFLVYYLLSNKKAASDPSYKAPISLYTIVSGSMEPTIKVYDVVVDVAVENPEDIQVGDVITFISTSSISTGLIVTHRVVEVRIVNGEYEYVTKGDFNGAADSDTAKFSNIIGKVNFVLPQLGRIQFFVSSKLGWFVVVLLPALGVIIYDVIKLIKLMGVKKTSDKVKTNINELSTGDQRIDEVLESIKKSDYINRLNDLQNSEKENK